MSSMTILDEIVEYKRKVVEQRKNAMPLGRLYESPFYQRTPISYLDAVRTHSGSGIIAEFKRRSPSKGWINEFADTQLVIPAYEQAGASAVSILTDDHFFGGSDEDLIAIRAKTNISILRKEFIIDAYQIHEAKAIGADIILLIAAILDPREVQEFTRIAFDLGLEVILELHDEEEMGHVCPGISLVGINNRNLKNFEVDIERSMRMIEALPKESLKIAESGITEPAQLAAFRQAGFEGFLIGERFMRTHEPGEALKDFLNKSHTV